MTGIITNKKIHSVLLFFVILGTVFANVHMYASLTPKEFTTEPSIQINNQQPEQHFTYELGYQSLTEIMEYIHSEAVNNNFRITTTVISAALLFESADTLIIIGHGHFGVTGQYFIGDYTAKRIQRFAQEKAHVALLACYSSVIELQNKFTLTYQEIIDLKSAIYDLFNLLGWKQNYDFIPTNNMNLFELDPDGAGGVTNAPYSNGIKYIYAPSIGYYWNINTETGFQSAGNWMLANTYILVKVYIDNSYYEKIGENSYQLVSGVTTFDAWIIIQSDTNHYVRIRNLIVCGVSKTNPYDFNLNNFVDILENDYFRNFVFGFLGSLAGAAIAFIITLGVKLIKKALFDSTKTILITVTEAGASVLGVNVGPYLLTIPTINYVLLTLGALLLIIAVLIISAALIYAFYQLQ